MEPQAVGAFGLAVALLLQLQQAVRIVRVLVVSLPEFVFLGLVTPYDPDVVHQVRDGTRALDVEFARHLVLRLPLLDVQHQVDMDTRVFCHRAEGVHESFLTVVVVFLLDHLGHVVDDEMLDLEFLH